MSELDKNSKATWRRELLFFFIHGTQKKSIKEACRAREIAKQSKAVKEQDIFDTGQAFSLIFFVSCRTPLFIDKENGDNPNSEKNSLQFNKGSIWGET